MYSQFYNPSSLSAQRLDRYLAAGWFRSNNLLHRSKLLCLDEGLFSIVNIRCNLKNHVPSKRLRKLQRQNESKFEIKVRPFTFSTEKDRLYSQHKHRFKGFVVNTLKQSLLGNDNFSIFNTWEVAIYDGIKLVAVSFFDLGKQSMASILALFDHEYSEYSLGLFTMLEEIKFAKEHRIKWYYPGYVLKNNSSFDYKLRLGNIEYYNWKGSWRKFEKLPEELFIVDKLSIALERVKTLLDSNGINSMKLIYPMFSLNYLQSERHSFFASPICLCQNYPNVHWDSWFIEFFPETEKYQLSLCAINTNFRPLIDMLKGSKSYNLDICLIDMMNYTNIICQTDSPEVLVKSLEKMLTSQELWLA